ncbi:hypothetical protein OIU78_016340 [Salix suchowensis]|nr:hypothetical protein OIU78_016340 [Salix suchowensis]
MIGRPLSCDSQTHNCERLEYARLCVEIDASLPKISCFDIINPLSSDPITVEVEYEWILPTAPAARSMVTLAKNLSNPWLLKTPGQQEPKQSLHPNSFYPQPPKTVTLIKTALSLSKPKKKPNSPTTTRAQDQSPKPTSSPLRTITNRPKDKANAFFQTT